eukprot:INCI763.1.p1 GENE.INCI763.1~~INCI763.1.p1  ORF type:complete len:520 (-),score=101.41 INCI763.1:991-2550(-)
MRAASALVLRGLARRATTRPHYARRATAVGNPSHPCVAQSSPAAATFVDAIPNTSRFFSGASAQSSSEPTESLPNQSGGRSGGRGVRGSAGRGSKGRGGFRRGGPGTVSTVVRADQTLLPTLSKSGGTLFLKSIAKKTSTTIQLEKDDTKLLIVSPSKANVNKAMHYLRGEKYESVAEYVDITKNAGLVIGANGRKLNELREEFDIEARLVNKYESTVPKTFCVVTGEPAAVKAAVKKIKEVREGTGGPQQSGASDGKRQHRRSRQERTQAAERDAQEGVSPTLKDLLLRATRRVAPGQNRRSDKGRELPPSLASIRNIAPHLSTDPIASLIHNVGAGPRKDEWVRLRGFSSHATKDDVCNFLEGIAVDRDDIKAEYDGSYRPTGDWYVKVPAADLALAFKRNMNTFGAKPIQMLTIKDTSKVKEATKAPLLKGKRPEHCVLLSNVPQSFYGESKRKYIKKFFRDYDLDVEQDVEFFNADNLTCSAIVSFKSRNDAMRAVREKHLGVMQNNEVNVMPLN